MLVIKLALSYVFCIHCGLCLVLLHSLVLLQKSMCYCTACWPQHRLGMWKPLLQCNAGRRVRQ